MSSVSTVETGVREITRDDLPELSRTASDAAGKSKNQYYRLAGAEAILLVLVAIAQLFTHSLGPQIADLLGLQVNDVHVLSFSIDAARVRDAIGAGIIPGALLVLVALVFIARVLLRPDDAWRGRRAVAESVVGLAWRFMMSALAGDLPNPEPGKKPGIEGFREEFDPLARDAEGLDLPQAKSSDEQITTVMRSLRDDPDLQIKAATYFQCRLENQLTFYTNRAKEFNGKTKRLRWATAGIYLLGGLLLFPFGGLSVVSTAAGATGSWLAAKHYADLAQSYGGMQRKLTTLKTAAASLDLSGPDAAARLARFVDEVEGLLAAEHQDWLARVAR